jgi:hypothetical protein
VRGRLADLGEEIFPRENTTLHLLGRILPLKISAEVKQIKEKMTIHEAVADLKAYGLDPLLALYLKRYPIGPDEDDPSWADGINPDLAPDITAVRLTEGTISA